MGKEIEHKYLVTSETYKTRAVKTTHIIQGYLSKDPERVVRVRIIDKSGFVTIKGKTEGDTRLEFEYEIPYNDALEMLKLCLGHPIEKRRWIVMNKGNRWEVDEFISPAFPTVAEIELANSNHDYPLPGFIGKEVTGDPKFYNSNIG